MRFPPGLSRADLEDCSFISEKKNPVLFSPVGTGKTHLAAAIANEVSQQETPVLFAIVPDLLDHLRKAIREGETTYHERMELLRDVSLLVLDDLGAEQSTPWAQETLYQIINYRYIWRLPTVLTSNCEPGRLDPRIFSRICDISLGQRIILDAVDYRCLSLQQRELLASSHEPSNATLRRYPDATNAQRIVYSSRRQH